MKQNHHELIVDVIKKIFPYYEKNEPGHRLDHALNTLKYGLKLAVFTKLDQQYINDVIIATLLHDIYARVEYHEIHHAMAYKEIMIGGHMYDWFMDTCDKYNSHPSIIQDAVYEHRATYDGKYSNNVAKITAAADRGKPCVKSICERFLTIFPNKKQSELIKIIQKKYGINGYARYPQIYKDYFGEALDMFQVVISNTQLLKKIF